MGIGIMDLLKMVISYRIAFTAQIEAALLILLGSVNSIKVVILPNLANFLVVLPVGGLAPLLSIYSDAMNRRDVINVLLRIQSVQMLENWRVNEVLEALVELAVEVEVVDWESISFV